jgi:hypothetical protein
MAEWEINNFPLQYEHKHSALTITWHAKSICGVLLCTAMNKLSQRGTTTICAISNLLTHILVLPSRIRYLNHIGNLDKFLYAAHHTTSTILQIYDG